MNTTNSEAVMQLVANWRGFNLLDFFWASETEPDVEITVSEDYCKWIRDWGFNVVRFPMDYRFWIDTDWRQNGRITSADEVFKIKDRMLDQIERSVNIVRSYGLHVILNFHRGPGYIIGENARNEPFDLWKDPVADEAFTYHWTHFAERFRDIPVAELSFNLLNEPSAVAKPGGYMPMSDYMRVMTHAIEGIRSVTPDRIIITDGVWYGKNVCEELIPLNIVQSGRGYSPPEVCQYGGPHDKGYPVPTWPILNEDGSVEYGREQLAEFYAPWGELTARVLPALCGECGCFNKTPHDVFLAWCRDLLDILVANRMGFIFWRLRQVMGVFDPERDDVDYENWHGHKLDRKFLELLREYI